MRPVKYFSSLAFSLNRHSFSTHSLRMLQSIRLIAFKGISRCFFCCSSKNLQPSIAGQRDLTGMDLAVGRLQKPRNGIIPPLIGPFRG